MECSKCGFDNPDQAKFCIECGIPFNFQCPNCGVETSASGKFCMECGFKLTPSQNSSHKELSFDEKIDKIYLFIPTGVTEKILSQRGKIEGERKQVTVMFCDLQGFTSMVERLGAEDAYNIMDQVYELLIHKVHDYDGTINEMTGDGIMALFGAPIALEDAPQRAIRSALAIHQEIGQYNDRMGDKILDTPRLRMRIGIHTGPVIVGTLGNDLRVDFKAVGDTVNTASRMEGLAVPGTACVSEDTFQLTEGLFRFEDLGVKEIKGKERPIKVYRVLGPSSRKTRFDANTERGLTPFIGREREMELLIDGFERTKEGRGQALSIIGEAGLGKSRLMYEFRKALAGENVTFLEGKCLSFSSNVAYHPVIDVLKSNFSINDEDNDEGIIEKIKKDLKVLEVDEAATLPYLLELLSVRQFEKDRTTLSPETMKVRIVEALARILVKGSQRRPVILAIEDLHWIDKSSEETLKSVLNSISGERIFLIFTYRPEYIHTWSGKSYLSQVNLNRLSNRQSLSMAVNLLNTKAIDRALEDLILEKTEGVPFFIEEFIKSFLSLNIIERKNDTIRLINDSQKLTIPATIQDVIMARIDSLPEEAKEVLQTGSVIEREFNYDLIRAVTGLPEQLLLSHLSALKDSELLFERGIYPQSTYVFRHALTQEVSYNSLIKKRRKEVHGKIADAMEDLYSVRLEETYEKLAYHYLESDNYKKASEYLKLSGKKAADRYSNFEAFRFYKELIRVLNQMPDTKDNKKEQIKTTLNISTPIRYLAYPEGSIKILKDGVRLSEEIDDKKSIAFFHSLIGKYYTFKGEPLKARKHQEDIFYKALEDRDIDIMAPVSDDLNSSYILTGDWEKIINISEPVIELLKKSKRELEYFDRTTCIYSGAFMASGLAEAGLGNFKEGERLIKKGLSNARKIQHLYTIGLGEMTYAHHFDIKGDGNKTVKHGKKAIKYFEESHTVNWMGTAYCRVGSGYYLLGDLINASKYIKEGIKIDKGLGISVLDAWYNLILGCICFEADEFENAKDYYEISVSLSHQSNYKNAEGWSLILLGRSMVRINSLHANKAGENILKNHIPLIGWELRTVELGQDIIY